MNNQKESKDQENLHQTDETTDVTRSQNREAVADAAEHPARATDSPGSQQQVAMDSTGSHREGNYDKNEPKDKSTELGQKK